MANQQAAVNLFTIIYIFLQYPMIKDIITCFRCNTNWLFVDQAPNIPFTSATPASTQNIDGNEVQLGGGNETTTSTTTPTYTCADYAITGLSVCQLGRLSSAISLITIISIILTLLIVGNKDADNHESLRDMYLAFTIIHICLTIFIVGITAWKDQSLARNSIYSYVIQFCLGFLFLTMYFSV